MPGTGAPTLLLCFPRRGSSRAQKVGLEEAGAGSGGAQCLPLAAGVVDRRMNPSRNNSWRGRRLNGKEKPGGKCWGFTFSRKRENVVTKIVTHKDDFAGNERFESLFPLLGKELLLSH